MDLRDKNTLDTVSVFDLMGNDFYIPDYQRGYRWTKNEVEKLLTDLEDFFKENNDGNSFYCMQPLVVYRNEGKWEVIDGQQRLTTLYLILKQKEARLIDDNPDIKLFNLSYKSREGSERYLKSVNKEDKDKNIDYYHIYNASQLIKDFLKNTSKGGGRFVDDIVNVNNSQKSPSVKFIWYDVTEEIRENHISPEEKFSDLNVGKISLTNAELIKALLLKNADNDDEALRIATEWDTIEHELCHDDFWTFIYGEDNGRYSTRIEYIFDIVKNKPRNNENDYYTFDEYTKDIAKNKPVKDLWREITNKFYLFKGWYEDRRLYHIIGFQRFLKKDISDIERCFEGSKTIDEFYEELKKDSIKSVISNKDIESLSYEESSDRKKIKQALVLFNVLSVLQCKESNLKFSFNEYYNGKWDIEHVRSQTPKDASGQDRENWIKCTLKYFTGIEYTEDNENPGAYKNKMKNLELSFDDKIICDGLITLLGNQERIDESDIYEKLCERFKYNDGFEYENSIGNLVLLDAQTNRAYKNAYFPVKRDWINRREKEGAYILPCTKNVFMKNYTEKLSDLMSWNNDDAINYTKAIKEVLEIEGE